MKYRIIKESDFNGDAFYEVHFYKQVRTFIFFKKWAWEPIEELHRSGYFTYPARYDSYNDAMKMVNRYGKTRSIVKEGEIEDEESNV